MGGGPTLWSSVASFAVMLMFRDEKCSLGLIPMQPSRELRVGVFAQMDQIDLSLLQDLEPITTYLIYISIANGPTTVVDS